MTATPKDNRMGLFSAGWMLGSFAIYAILRSSELRVHWLLGLLLVLSWLAVWLVSAAVGLVRGGILGRMCALIAIGVLLFVFWQMLQPVNTKAMRPNMLIGYINS